MDISTEIAAIEAASEGEELRQPLIDALDTLNSGSLPAVTPSDAGKILKVNSSGEWVVGEKSGYMPVPSASLNISSNDTYDVTDYAQAIVSVSGGSGSVLVPKTITQNGIYNPADDNVDGYSSVSVIVPSGEISYLPNSNQNNILFSKKTGLNQSEINEISNFYNGTNFNVQLSDNNTDVTCYCVPKYTNGSGEIIFMAVPYANSSGNAPCFYCASNSLQVECTIYAGNTALSGVSINDWHVFAFSINANTKKVRYFYDGVYAMEKTFNNSGTVVSFGKSLNNTYNGKAINFAYCGIVEECESDATIIANMQEIMSIFNISA